MKTVDWQPVYFLWVLAAIVVIVVLRLAIEYRRNRIESLRPEAESRIPPPDSVVWAPRQCPTFVFDATEIADNGSERAASSETFGATKIDELGYGAAAADAAFSAAPMMAAGELLNPDVLDALVRWVNHGDAFTGTQLFDYLHDHHDAIFSAATGPGFVTALQGFVGEQVAYHDLVTQGNSVDMPDITNVPDWDLNVDGHLFQVKVGDSALSHATQAANAHPEIGIISDPMVAAHFHDSIGLEHLDPEHIATITDHTLTSASVLADGPAFHFPVITLLRVTWREIDLLSKNHTTGDVALKNAALDVFGVGGGAYAGGQLGLAIGAFFTPVGAAVGTVFGTLVGAIFGRFYSDSFKEKAFKKAIADYEFARSKVEPVLEKTRKYRQRSIIDYVKSRDASLTIAIRQERRLFLDAARKGVDDIRVDRRAACKSFVLHLGQLKRLLREGLRDFERAHQSPWLRRTFLPEEGDVAIILARRWARSAERCLDQLRKELSILIASSDESQWDEAVQKIADFIRTFECDSESYYSEIRVGANHALAIKREMEHRKNAYDDRVRSLVVHAQREVNAFIDATHILFSREIGDIMKPVTDALETIRHEGRRLGKSIP
jgi:hypothetical protein